VRVQTIQHLLISHLERRDAIYSSHLLLEFAAEFERAGAAVLGWQGLESLILALAKVCVLAGSLSIPRNALDTGHQLHPMSSSFPRDLVEKLDVNRSSLRCRSRPTRRPGRRDPDARVAQPASDHYAARRDRPSRVRCGDGCARANRIRPAPMKRFVFVPPTSSASGITKNQRPRSGRSTDGRHRKGEHIPRIPLSTCTELISHGSPSRNASICRRSTIAHRLQGVSLFSVATDADGGH